MKPHSKDTLIIAGLIFYPLKSLGPIFTSPPKPNSSWHCMSAKRHARVENVLCSQFQEWQQHAGAPSQSRPKCSQRHHPGGCLSSSSPQSKGWPMPGWTSRTAGTSSGIQHHGERQPGSCPRGAHSAAPPEPFSTTDSSQQFASGRRTCRSSGRRKETTPASRLCRAPSPLPLGPHGHATHPSPAPSPPPLGPHWHATHPSPPGHRRRADMQIR